ncbi:hypothetical protein HMPREF0497_2894, partial [Lentilactobacillus buchneri ATCC 11577]
MKNYPSNITRQQFELIRPTLENFRKRTQPRKYDLYEVFCAALYALKTVAKNVHMTRVNVSDRDGASAMVALNAEHLCRVRNVLVDGGYSGVNFRFDVASNLNATVQVAK